jgi:hypothetical protein
MNKRGVTDKRQRAKRRLRVYHRPLVRATYKKAAVPDLPRLLGLKLAKQIENASRAFKGHLLNCCAEGLRGHLAHGGHHLGWWVGQKDKKESRIVEDKSRGLLFFFLQAMATLSHQASSPGLSCSPRIGRGQGHRPGGWPCLQATQHALGDVVCDGETEKDIKARRAPPAYSYSQGSIQISGHSHLLWQLLRAKAGGVAVVLDNFAEAHAGALPDFPDGVKEVVACSRGHMFSRARQMQ